MAKATASQVVVGSWGAEVTVGVTVVPKVEAAREVGRAMVLVVSVMVAKDLEEEEWVLVCVEELEAPVAMQGVAQVDLSVVAATAAAAAAKAVGLEASCLCKSDPALHLVPKFRSEIPAP